MSPNPHSLPPLRRHEGPSAVVHARFRARVEPNSAACDRDPQILVAVARAKAGDRDAIRFLYVRYADRVYGYVLSLVRDEHEAEDLTQQVFTGLISSIGSYQPRTVPFAAWIVRVARNATLDHLRRRRQVPCGDVFAADACVDERPAHLRRSLTAALATLPCDQRKVVVLRHFAGLSGAEIAERMGRSVGAVDTLHSRGRGALRLELERLDAMPAVA